MKEEKIYFERILSIINDIEKYIGNDIFETFKSNEMQIDASIMKLQTLGETIKKIGKYDTIPYDEIIGLRDWISHDYFGLDLEIIYLTLKKDIPELKDKILEIYNKKYK